MITSSGFQQNQPCPRRPGYPASFVEVSLTFTELLLFASMGHCNLLRDPPHRQEEDSCPQGAFQQPRHCLSPSVFLPGRLGNRREPGGAPGEAVQSLGVWVRLKTIRREEREQEKESLPSESCGEQSSVDRCPRGCRDGPHSEKTVYCRAECQETENLLAFPQGL